MTRGEQISSAAWLRAYAARKHAELSGLPNDDASRLVELQTALLVEAAACAKAAEILEACAADADG